MAFDISIQRCALLSLTTSQKACTQCQVCYNYLCNQRNTEKVNQVQSQNAGIFTNSHINRLIINCQLLCTPAQAPWHHPRVMQKYNNQPYFLLGSQQTHLTTLFSTQFTNNVNIKEQLQQTLGEMFNILIMSPFFHNND